MRHTQRLLLLAAVSASVLMVGLIGVAWAAPPTNDTFAGATVIPSLPFNTTEDTTQATLDASDTAAQSACYTPSGFTFSNSVWFAYTPSADQQVGIDTSGSSYPVAGAVLTGTPGAFSSVSCFFGNTSFAATSGTTYYFDLAEEPAGGGGTLNLAVTQQLPPNPVLTVDSSGTFTKAGSATLSGTASCSPGAFASISATLTQSVGRIATVSGFGSTSQLVCDGTPHAWSLTVTPSSGKFRGGAATATVDMFACTYTCELAPESVSTIHLKH